MIFFYSQYERETGGSKNIKFIEEYFFNIFFYFFYIKIHLYPHFHIHIHKNK